MTAIARLMEEHRLTIAEALDLGWGPWRLHDARHLRRVAGRRHDGAIGSWLVISLDSLAGDLATNDLLSASDVGHLLFALRDCAYARAIGAGPWATEVQP